MRSRALPLLTGLVTLASVTVWATAFRRTTPPEPPPAVQRAAPRAQVTREIPYEEWARREFLQDHPGQKPLNWEIAREAERFYRTQPMGRFVLDINDCSDFADAVIDEALGYGARQHRNSDRHLIAWYRDAWGLLYWDRETPLMPGDEISVEHSPHYAPYAGATRHCGIIGTDGMVYDWTKLKRWSGSRYGRHTIEWFVRNTHEPDGIIVRRLKPEYRYLIEPLPHASELAGLTRAVPQLPQTTH